MDDRKEPIPVHVRTMAAQKLSHFPDWMMTADGTDEPRDAFQRDLERESID